MRRSKLEIAGDTLQEIAEKPHLAPTRITSRAGINYAELQPLLTKQLITLQQTSKKRRTISLTEKGKKYLQHYYALKQLIA